MYEIGDYVVKANNGVCRIDNIQHLDLPNTLALSLAMTLSLAACGGGNTAESAGRSAGMGSNPDDTGSGSRMDYK